MKRLMVLAAALAVGALVFDAGARAQDDKKKKDAATIKKIMQASFGGKMNYRSRIKEAVGDKDWDTAAKEAKAWLKHAKALPSLKPPVGDMAGYKKQAETLVKTITTLNKGIDDKNANVANGAIGRINGTCKSCHDNYRPKAKKRP